MKEIGKRIPRAVMDYAKKRIQKFYRQLELATKNFSNRDTAPTPSIDFKLAIDISGVQKLADELMSEGIQKPLFEYAVIKTILKYFEKNINTPVHDSLQRRLINLSWYIGEYDETISLADQWLSTYKCDTKRAAIKHCQILNRKAKAFRNKGKFDDALILYRIALQICDQWELKIEKAFELMMIGKMYGNFQNQNSNLKSVENESIEYKIINYQAICYDSLGQIHSKNMAGWKEALSYYNKATELNKKIYNKNGLSRNFCHIANLKAKWDKNATESDIFKFFDEGYRLLIRDITQKRGIGVRKIEKGQLLFQFGNASKAIEQINSGIDTAKSYRDYRTVIRGYISQADIMKDNDTNTALKVLRDGRKLAKDFNLYYYQLEINRRLGDFLSSSTNPSSVFQSLEYFHDNRMILQKFRENVVRNNTKFAPSDESNNNKDTHPEIHHLSEGQLLTLYKGLLRDYDLIVEQLNMNFQTIIEVLKQGREVSLLGISECLNRAFSHDVKFFLPILSNKTLWKDLFININSCISMVQEFHRKHPDQQVFRNMSPKLGSIKSDLKILSDLVIDFERTLENRLAKPKRGAEKAILCKCCERSKELLIERNIVTLDQIETDYQIDLQLPCYEEWIVRVIENLLQNGYEAYLRGSFDAGVSPLLYIRTYKEITGSIEVENPAYLVILEISNVGRPGDLYRLQKAIQNPGWSDKKKGNGIGIEFAVLIFKNICDAEIDALESDGLTKIRFRFQPNNVLIKSLKYNQNNSE
jgi:tetratricopeptide (TPR) repeat protein